MLWLDALDLLSNDTLLVEDPEELELLVDWLELLTVLLDALLLDAELLDALLELADDDDCDDRELLLDEDAEDEEESEDEEAEELLLSSSQLMTRVSPDVLVLGAKYGGVAVTVTPQLSLRTTVDARSFSTRIRYRRESVKSICSVSVVPDRVCRVMMSPVSGLPMPPVMSVMVTRTLSYAPDGHGPK